MPSFDLHEHQAFSGQEKHKPKALLWKYIKNFINSTIGREKKTQEKPSETFPQRRYINNQKMFDLSHQRNANKNKEDHFIATRIDTAIFKIRKLITNSIPVTAQSAAP